MRIEKWMLLVRGGLLLLLLAVFMLLLLLSVLLLLRLVLIWFNWSIWITVDCRTIKLHSWRLLQLLLWLQLHLQLLLLWFCLLRLLLARILIFIWCYYLLSRVESWINYSPWLIVLSMWLRRSRRRTLICIIKSPLWYFLECLSRRSVQHEDPWVLRSFCSASCPIDNNSWSTCRLRCCSG